MKLLNISQPHRLDFPRPATDFSRKLQLLIFRNADFNKIKQKSAKLNSSLLEIKPQNVFSTLVWKKRSIQATVRQIDASLIFKLIAYRASQKTWYLITINDFGTYLYLQKTMLWILRVIFLYTDFNNKHIQLFIFATNYFFE